MALISSLPCNLSLCLNHKLSRKASPRLGQKILSPVNNSLPKAEGVILRRTGNHHGNLWDDDFIQSLPQHPYQASCYGERSERLIKEIKDVFKAMAAPQAGNSSTDNVVERLTMVDDIERLGIDRHFQEEITEALDYVYRHWSECGRDLNTTALGFRVLRLHRYHVSSDMLGQFKIANEQFLSSTIHSEEEIKCILNLYRASLIAFPGEKIMDEAKTFTTTYLYQALHKTRINSKLFQEISFNLEYGWHTNLPRLEARNYMDIYEEKTSWAREVDFKKLLYLAKLDFNMMQSLHQQELQILSRWWREKGLCKLSFSRHRHVEYFFLACAICEDAKYSSFRSGVAKFCALGTYLDDIYDTYGTLDELKLFTDIIKRWDPSPAACLPKYMKITYKSLYETINEMAREVEKIQGRDILAYARKAWEVYIDAMMQEAEWLATGYIPTLDEYLQNGKVSAGTSTPTWIPVLTLDGVLPEIILQKIDYPSKFDELLGLTLRLKGDIRTFKSEADRGEVASSITCYMRDNIGSTKEDALKYLTALLDECLKELNLEYLKHDNIPTCSMDHAYDISKGFRLFYKEGDGFSVSSNDIKNLVTQILFDHVTM